MTKEAVASWLMEHSSVPQTVLKPLATKLGVPTNYVGAALFAGQIVYENQDRIVTYASKGGVTVGEFLYERSRQRYGEDHPLTEHLGENVEAITEAFEGTEEEARSFAAFFRQYRALDRNHRLRDEIGRQMPEAIPDVDVIPDTDAIPGKEAIPGPSFRSSEPEADDADEVVEVPVTEAE